MRFRSGARSVRTCLEIVVTLSAVAGCAPAPDHTSRTVDYFRQHAQERAQVLSHCSDNPGDNAREPDCVNAREAERIEGVGSLRSLPPMGLPSTPNRGAQQ